MRLSMTRWCQTSRPKQGLASITAYSRFPGRSCRGRVDESRPKRGLASIAAWQPAVRRARAESRPKRGLASIAASVIRKLTVSRTSRHISERWLLSLPIPLSGRLLLRRSDWETLVLQDYRVETKARSRIDCYQAGRMGSRSMSRDQNGISHRLLPGHVGLRQATGTYRDQSAVHPESR
jgi:hypothetical protein